MNKLIYLLLIGALLSCNPYLEVVPDASLDVKIDSEDKIAELLTGAYPTISYFSFLEARTDNVADRGSGRKVRINEAMYYWQDFDQDDLDHPSSYWNDCYRGIAQANHALEYLGQYPQKNERINALYGEAFLLRAYLHFMLVNIWGMPYHPNATEQAGIPYVDRAEKNAFPQRVRLSVKEVYDSIEKDLLRGLDLVNDRFYKNPAFHFNKAAAYAFASRFYLHKGDWDKVIAYSDFVLGADPTQKIRDLYKNYGNTHFDLFSSPQESANLLITATESRWKRELSTNRYGMNRALHDELLIKFAKKDWTYNYESRNAGGGYYVLKFTDFEKFGNTGINPRGIYVMNNLFTVDEVLLNRAEAYAMKFNYTLSSFDILGFMSKKSGRVYHTLEDFLAIYPNAHENFTPFYRMSIQQASLVNCIAELRRREFLHEGLRWFDIKRFKILINRNKAGEEDTTENVLRKNDPRRALQIPAQALTKDGLLPNPR